MPEYKEKYWDYQKGIGSKKYHTIYNKSKFSAHIKNDSIVLDFGCGGGYVLNEINCKEKFGIEINESAIKQAKTFGIKISEDFNDLKDNFFDVIISNSALEHVENPKEILDQCYRVLKRGGFLYLSVPHEELSYKYRTNDINQHLYTWSPMSIGNLVNSSGFLVKKVKVIKIIQPLFAGIIFKYFGLKGYKFIGKIYRFFRQLIQGIKSVGISADIFIIAEKK